MAAIAVTAEAGLDIARRLATGELEVAGIQVRDTATKQIRYILEGLENFPSDSAKLDELPGLEPLRAALVATQLLQVMTAAQNAAMAASLHRIERSLERIGRRLEGMEGRLAHIQTQQTLVLAALKDSGVNRLKVAKTAAMVALQHDYRTALQAAGRDADRAARDLLAQSRRLVTVREDGFPVALQAPSELADLASSSVEAARLASAIWLALNAKDAAGSLMKDVADELESMRQQLASALRDPHLIVRLVSSKLASDEELVKAGKQLQIAFQQARGRELMIGLGCFGPDPLRREFEVVAPAPSEPSFVPIADLVQEQAAE